MKHYFIGILFGVNIVFQQLQVLASPYFHTGIGTNFWSGFAQQPQIQNQRVVLAAGAPTFFLTNNLYGNAKDQQNTDNNNNSSDLCKESNGQFADPKYCDKYYDCWEGRPVSSGQCTHGLMFNEQISACDYPSNVNCDGKEVNQPFDDLDKGCEQAYGTFADPRDCRKFTVCHAGRATYYICEEGLAYDKETGLCAPPPEPLCLQGPPNDIPEGSDVPEVPLDPDTIKPVPPGGPSGGDEGGSLFPITPDWPQGTKCPIASTGFLPVAKDCRSVLVCVNGNGYLLNCPPGTFYHASKASCLPGKSDSCEQMRFSSNPIIKTSGNAQYALYHPRFPLLPTKKY